MVDDVCGGGASPAPDGDPGEHRCCCYCDSSLRAAPVGFSGTYYLVPEPGAADATYAWSVDTGANVTAPGTGESAVCRSELHCCWYHCDYLCDQLCYCC